MARHNDIGSLGESLAREWLTTKGYSVIDTNYRKSAGEIDIIAQKLAKIHFVEVKTVSYETINILRENVSRETYRPEDNVHFSKLKRLQRAIELWFLEHESLSDFQIDVVTVKVVPREKYALVELIENVVLE